MDIINMGQPYCQPNPSNNEKKDSVMQRAGYGVLGLGGVGTGVWTMLKGDDIFDRRTNASPKELKEQSITGAIANDLTKNPKSWAGSIAVEVVGGVVAVLGASALYRAFTGKAPQKKNT
jgi:hypothetical protein